MKRDQRQIHTNMGIPTTFPAGGEVKKDIFGIHFADNPVAFLVSLFLMKYQPSWVI